MNRELEDLILAYEAVSASRDKEAERCMAVYDSMLDQVIERNPGYSRDTLHKAILRAHRKWALKQESKPPAIPPKA